MSNPDVLPFFKYENKYMNQSGSGIVYKNCIILIDFSSFKKGEQYNIFIYEGGYHKFKMYIGCDLDGKNGTEFEIEPFQIFFNNLKNSLIPDICVSLILI